MQLFQPFTFHYVSTYTVYQIGVSADSNQFTFHYVSTYTRLFRSFVAARLYLHSTMFLLIRYLASGEDVKVLIYIPLCFYLYRISQKSSMNLTTIYIPLCFYLYNFPEMDTQLIKHLHSTMFLLIRLHRKSVKCSDIQFTFHYVSTYTPEESVLSPHSKNLHSTMFLLILSRSLFDNTLFQYLHSTMFLLIRRRETEQSAVSRLIYIPLCFYLYTV